MKKLFTRLTAVIIALCASLAVSAQSPIVSKTWDLKANNNYDEIAISGSWNNIFYKGSGWSATAVGSSMSIEYDFVKGAAYTFEIKSERYDWGQLSIYYAEDPNNKVLVAQGNQDDLEPDEDFKYFGTPEFTSTFTGRGYIIIVNDVINDYTGSNFFEAVRINQWTEGEGNSQGGGEDPNPGQGGEGPDPGQGGEGPDPGQGGEDPTPGEDPATGEENVTFWNFRDGVTEANVIYGKWETSSNGFQTASECGAIYLNYTFEEGATYSLEFTMNGNADPTAVLYGESIEGGDFKTLTAVEDGYDETDWHKIYKVETFGGDYVGAGVIGFYIYNVNYTDGMKAAISTVKITKTGSSAPAQPASLAASVADLKATLTCTLTDYQSIERVEIYGKLTTAEEYGLIADFGAPASASFSYTTNELPEGNYTFMIKVINTVGTAEATFPAVKVVDNRGAITTTQALPYTCNFNNRWLNNGGFQLCTSDLQYITENGNTSSPYWIYDSAYGSGFYHEGTQAGGVFPMVSYFFTPGFALEGGHTYKLTLGGYISGAELKVTYGKKATPNACTSVIRSAESSGLNSYEFTPTEDGTYTLCFEGRTLSGGNYLEITTLTLAEVLPDAAPAATTISATAEEETVTVSFTVPSKDANGNTVGMNGSNYMTKVELYCDGNLVSHKSSSSTYMGSNWVGTFDAAPGQHEVYAKLYKGELFYETNHVNVTTTAAPMMEFPYELSFAASNQSVWGKLDLYDNNMNKIGKLGNDNYRANVSGGYLRCGQYYNSYVVLPKAQLTAGKIYRFNVNYGSWNYQVIVRKGAVNANENAYSNYLSSNGNFEWTCPESGEYYIMLYNCSTGSNANAFSLFTIKELTIGAPGTPNAWVNADENDGTIYCNYWAPYSDSEGLTYPDGSEFDVYAHVSNVATNGTMTLREDWTHFTVAKNNSVNIEIAQYETNKWYDFTFELYVEYNGQASPVTTSTFKRGLDPQILSKEMVVEDGALVFNAVINTETTNGGRAISEMGTLKYHFGDNEWAEVPADGKVSKVVATELSFGSYSQRVYVAIFDNEDNRVANADASQSYNYNKLGEGPNMLTYETDDTVDDEAYASVEANTIVRKSVYNTQWQYWDSKYYARVINLTDAYPFAMDGNKLNYDWDDVNGVSIDCIYVDKLNYTRTFANHNEWQAWFVPFDIEIEGNFQIAIEFAGVVDRNGVHSVLFEPVEGNVLKANTPYMVKPLAHHQGNEYTFTVEDTRMINAPTVWSEVAGGRVPDTKVQHIFNDGGIDYTYTLDGTYQHKTNMATDNNFALAQGAFWGTTDDDQALKPFRIFMSVPKIYGANSIKIYVDEEATEGIEEIDADQLEGDIYDIQGRRVQAPRAGKVYILNGQKVLVK